MFAPSSFALAREKIRHRLAKECRPPDVWDRGAGVGPSGSFGHASVVAVVAEESDSDYFVLAASAVLRHHEMTRVAQDAFAAVL